MGCELVNIEAEGSNDSIHWQKFMHRDRDRLNRKYADDLGAHLRAIEFSSLLFRPIRKTGESKKGYLKRVLTENCLSHKVEKAIRFEDSRGGSISFSLAYRISSFDRIIKNKTWPRYCSRCLSEGAYWRAEWDFVFFDACPKHECWLRDTCPVCETRLSWKRDNLTSCHCGASFLTHQIEPCPQSVTDLMNSFRYTLNLSSVSSELSKWMSGDERVFYHLVVALGSLSSWTKRTKTRTRIEVGNLSVSRNYVATAANILSNWPKQFHHSLENVENQFRLAVNSDSVPDCFGRFYRELFSSQSHQRLRSPYKFVHDEFSKYLLKSWRGIICNRNRSISVDMRSEGAWTTSKNVTKALGISNRQLDKMIDEGKLTGKRSRQPKSGRVKTIVRKDGLPTVLEYLQKAVRLKYVEQALGTTKKRTRLLQPVLFPNAEKSVGNGNTPWMVNREQIDLIFQRYRELESRSSINTGEVDFGQVMRYWKWSNHMVGTAINGVAEGHLQPIARSSLQPGVAGWIFKAADLEQWINVNFPKDGDTVSIPEFAKSLGMKQEVAYFLVNAKIVNSKYFEWGKSGEQRILISDMVEFEENFVFLSKLVGQLKTTSKKLLENLRRFAIYPISGPYIDGGRQYLMKNTLELHDAIQHLQTERNQDLV